jgi:hypothetical protein
MKVVDLDRETVKQGTERTPEAQEKTGRRPSAAISAFKASGSKLESGCETEPGMRPRANS